MRKSQQNHRHRSTTTTTNREIKSFPKTKKESKSHYFVIFALLIFLFDCTSRARYLGASEDARDARNHGDAMTTHSTRKKRGKCANWNSSIALSAFFIIIILYSLFPLSLSECTHTLFSIFTFYHFTAPKNKNSAVIFIHNAFFGIIYIRGRYAFAANIGAAVNGERRTRFQIENGYGAIMNCIRQRNFHRSPFFRFFMRKFSAAEWSSHQLKMVHHCVGVGVFAMQVVRWKAFKCDSPFCVRWFIAHSITIANNDKNVACSLLAYSAWKASAVGGEGARRKMRLMRWHLNAHRM